MAKRLSPNMTITVPAELRAQMDTAPEKTNWSAVATEAFEKKLTEIASRQEGASVEDVIARMKASDKLESNADYQEGHMAGQAWAKTQATSKQLRRLIKYTAEPNSGGIDWWDIDNPEWGGGFGATDYFVFELWPGREGDSDAPDEFWHLALSERDYRIDDPDFFRGFGEGAVEVWNKIKNHF